MPRLDADVREVLRGLEFVETRDGIVGKIPDGQLERKLYMRVNKVLENFGGKWNRKHGGHLFNDDAAQAAVEMASATGEWTDKKQQLGFFETPDKLAARLVELARLAHWHPEGTPEGWQPQEWNDDDQRPWILEPSAGRGRLIEAIRNVWTHATVGAYEIDETHKNYLGSRTQWVRFMDFLDAIPPSFNSGDRGYDFVLMNPPFRNQADVDHVLHAWKFVRPGGRLVAIMSPSWTFRTNRKSLDFAEFVASQRNWIHHVEAGAFAESGTQISTRILVLQK